MIRGWKYGGDLAKMTAYIPIPELTLPTHIHQSIRLVSTSKRFRGDEALRILFQLPLDHSNSLRVKLSLHFSLSDPHSHFGNRVSRVRAPGTLGGPELSADIVNGFLFGVIGFQLLFDLELLDTHCQRSIGGNGGAPQRACRSRRAYGVRLKIGHWAKGCLQISFEFQRILSCGEDGQRRFNRGVVNGLLNVLIGNRTLYRREELYDCFSSTTCHVRYLVTAKIGSPVCRHSGSGEDIG